MIVGKVLHTLSLRGLCCSPAIRNNLRNRNSIHSISIANFAASRKGEQYDRSDILYSTMAGIEKQPFDYYLVLDFEATCDLKEANKRIHPKEIIEFPVLKVSGKTFETEAVFHTYVQPKVHPALTPFCTHLTGIVQEMVDGKPFFEDVLADFHKWLVAEGLLEPSLNFTFVTCGDWDLNIMLPQQCNYFHIPVPPYFNHWINIKRTFADHTMKYVKGLTDMLTELKIPFQGRLHSGIDDCRNIAVVLSELANRGVILKINGQQRR